MNDSPATLDLDAIEAQVYAGRPDGTVNLLVDALQTADEQFDGAFLVLSRDGRLSFSRSDIADLLESLRVSRAAVPALVAAIRERDARIASAEFRLEASTAEQDFQVKRAETAEAERDAAREALARVEALDAEELRREVFILTKMGLVGYTREGAERLFDNRENYAASDNPPGSSRMQRDTRNDIAGEREDFKRIVLAVKALAGTGTPLADRRKELAELRREVKALRSCDSKFAPMARDVSDCRPPRRAAREGD
jgi:hypothetical protein